MAIDYDAANAHIQNTLGGEMSLDLDDLSLMDQAGHFMCALYPWKHLERTTAALGTLTVSGPEAIAASGEKAPYITALLGYTPRGTDSRVTGERAYLVTPEELLDLREGAADPDGAASGTVLDTGNSDSLNYFAVQYSSASPPVVELDCLCDATIPIATVVLRYRKGWTPSTADGVAFEMPVWMEPVYILLARICSWVRGRRRCLFEHASR